MGREAIRPVWQVKCSGWCGLGSQEASTLQAHCWGSEAHTGGRTQMKGLGLCSCLTPWGWYDFSSMSDASTSLNAVFSDWEREASTSWKLLFCMTACYFAWLPSSSYGYLPLPFSVSHNLQRQCVLTYFSSWEGAVFSPYISFISHRNSMWDLKTIGLHGILVPI